jgi:hypothetical protein
MGRHINREIVVNVEQTFLSVILKFNSCQTGMSGPHCLDCTPSFIVKYCLFKKIMFYFKNAILLSGLPGLFLLTMLLLS